MTPPWLWGKLVCLSPCEALFPPRPPPERSTLPAAPQPILRPYTFTPQLSPTAAPRLRQGLCAGLARMGVGLKGPGGQAGFQAWEESGATGDSAATRALSLGCSPTPNSPAVRLWNAFAAC